MAGDSIKLLIPLRSEAAAIRRWQALADSALAAPDRASREEHEREEAIDAYRDAHAATLSAITSERREAQQRAKHFSIGIIIALLVLLGMPAYFVVERGARRSARRARDDERFGDAIQFARTQDDAHEVLRRHLDVTLVKARSVVLNRNNSADRLEASTPVEEGSLLAAKLEGAGPEDCLAVRRGSLHRRRKGEPELLSCGICGAVGDNVTCAPSLVGGEVIGSVLVEHASTPKAEDEDRLRGRGRRGRSDHRQPAQPRVRRGPRADGHAHGPAQQAGARRDVQARGRPVAPPRIAARGDPFDLDHFKQVNDRHGHETGDELLAALGAAIPGALRASDVAGRFGGEEFLALLPGTDRDGALLVAHKIRETIAAVVIGDGACSVTASFGVAVMPDDAEEGGELLRLADRALYRAKAEGRDRVETVPARHLDGAIHLARG
jgi:diguanylate cyclase (GGDEF)-like protein